MLLKSLIKKHPKKLGNVNITGLALDSRKIKRGNIFFSLKGTKKNGDIFINSAIKKGAKIIIIDHKSKIKKSKVDIIKVKDTQKTLKEACKNFYFKKPKNIIAVTGTNGKSSVADFFYQILSLNKIKAASIGTLGIKKNNKTTRTNLTSPDIISLHSELYKLKKEKIENVIIEASSHGLKQGRLDGINFKAGIFTNFTQDHLDYHLTMSDYFKSKMLLFSKILKNKKHIILKENSKEFKKIKQIAINKKFKILKTSQIQNKLNKIENLTGEFQIENLSMAILAAGLCGLNLKKIINNLQKIKSVNGRLELVKTFNNKSKVYLDYAHTPHALETVIKSLVKKYKKKIVLVFGCGGERDHKKRKIMAKIANKLCKKIYVTDDNPRNEDPKKIKKDITKKIEKKLFLEIGDRKKAIQESIKKSDYSDVILIAGKGHETNQIYKKKIIKISDREIIKNFKLSKFKYNEKKINFLKNAKIINKIINKRKNIEFSGVSFNSKEIKKNNLFIALKGNKRNGHSFVVDALSKGASYAVVSKVVKKFLPKQIKVKNTKTFLNKLAKLKRNFSNANIIAITGSSGKTTLKTLLGEVLKNYKQTYYAPKSYNNSYGVPISLCNLENKHKYGVFEIGMNKPGEIKTLSEMVKPQIGVITNVSEAHIQNFTNLNGIAKAKAEIIKSITKNGTMILNKDDKFFNFFKKLSEKEKLKIVSFGLSKYSDIHPASTKNLKNYKLLKIKVFNKVVDIENKSNIRISNLLALIAVLETLKLDLKSVENKLNNIHPLEGRGKSHLIHRYKTKFNLVDESYNANPRSMMDAISNFSKKNTGAKKYLLLGDMLELGVKSNFYHKNLSKFINSTEIDKLFVYGNKILNTYKYIYPEKRGNILQSKSDFDEVFSKVLKKGDYLMIKASNGIGLNSLSKQIIKGVKNVI